jgi:predicted phosphodiesterase
MNDDVSKSDEEQRDYRDSGRLLKMPSTQGTSHARTQLDLFEERVRPDDTNFKKAKDFLETRIWLWVWHYLKSRFGGRYEFQDYENGSGDRGIYPLDPSDVSDPGGSITKISMTGDWASGTRDAQEIGMAMASGDPDFTIHLGDIYYVGTRREIRENMLGGMTRWPQGVRGSFALNANHEMYARGKAYFKHLLPSLGLHGPPGGESQGQKASFFCLRNDHWVIVGLDTGYYSVGIPIIEKILKPSCRQHDKTLRWLRDKVRLQDDRQRGVILLSHHQYYSQFESYFERSAKQLSQLLDRPVLWFWGHEHRLALYGKHGTRSGVLEAFGRCLGHGGLPIEDIREEPKGDAKHQVGLVLYDRRKKKVIGSDDTPVGYNGYADLLFEGPRLRVEYRDAENLLVSEEWEVDGAGHLRGLGIEKHLQDEDIVIHEGASLEDAQK